MTSLLEVKRAPDGRLLARRKDGLPLTPEDREQARRLASVPPEPLLPPDDWLPLLREAFNRTVEETKDLDLAWVKTARPDLYQRLKDVEAEIDRLGDAPRSQVERLLARWRDAILEAWKAYREALVPLLTEPETEKIRAVKIHSRVLGDDVWLAFDRDFRPGDGLAIYYAEELAALESKSPEELRQIHKVKLVFPGARVVQDGPGMEDARGERPGRTDRRRPARTAEGGSQGEDVVSGGRGLDGTG